MYADKNSLSENLGLVFKEKQTLINLRKQTPILGEKKSQFQADEITLGTES